MVCLFFRYISVQLITEETERARSIKLVCGIVYMLLYNNNNNNNNNNSERK